MSTSRNRVPSIGKVAGAQSGVANHARKSVQPDRGDSDTPAKLSLHRLARVLGRAAAGDIATEMCPRRAADRQGKVLGRFLLGLLALAIAAVLLLCSLGK